MVKCNRLHLITKSNRADGYLLSNPTTSQPPLFPSICTLSLPHHSSMGWLHSLFSPLRKLWVRAHSARRNRKLFLRTHSFNMHQLLLVISAIAKPFSLIILRGEIDLFLPSNVVMALTLLCLMLSWQGGECTFCTRMSSLARMRMCMFYGPYWWIRTVTQL